MRRFARRKMLLVAATVLAAGCRVGPNYRRPAAVTPPAFKQQPPLQFTESEEWKFARPADTQLRGKWWELFNDPVLNELEEHINVSNQNLLAAEARFRQARATLRATRSNRFPTIGVTPGIGALRNSSNRAGFASNQATTRSANLILPFDFNYEVDVWGRVRRSIEASRDLAQASAADLEAIRLSLHAELAQLYFQLRETDAQQRVLAETVHALEGSVQLATNRYEGGVAPRSDVAQAESQLASTRAELTETGIARAQLEHAIAVLTGQPPASLNIPTATQQSFQPPVVPVALPSQLLERRPDIAAMERRMAAANEQIGITQAAFYPTFRFSSSLGMQGTSLANWLTWPSHIWSIGPTAAQTLFDAGRRQAASEAASASYEATVASYRQTTLNAFQEVEDQLAALRVLETEAMEQAEAVRSSQEALQLARNRYEGGIETYLEVLTAQTIALASQRRMTSIEARRMGATVLLIRALGGGWNESQLPALDR